MPAVVYTSPAARHRNPVLVYFGSHVRHVLPPMLRDALLENTKPAMLKPQGVPEAVGGTEP